MKATALHIVPAESSAQIEQARELFLEYAQSLGFSLCFQNFDKELADLPGEYVPPNGGLLLAESEGKLAGCVALHRLATTSDAKLSNANICEMKRLYVRPDFRGQNIGRNLAERGRTCHRRSAYDWIHLSCVWTRSAEKWIARL